ncbi:MAG: phosphatase PAP2 family protein [Aquihabitans sp.]
MTVTEPQRTSPALKWWREIVIAGAFYLIYSLVRNRFGAGPESRSIAYRHARGVIKVEEWLGLWFEPRLQQWYLGLPGHGMIRWWNIFYGTAHFAVTIGVLVIAFRKAPERYRFVRTMLAGATALALFGFAAYTLMPPRLLDSTSIFGACQGARSTCTDYGLVDTIERWGGLWKFGSGGMANVSNQYAAMPSLHFGWSTWCAVTVVIVVGKGRARWLAFLYPATTLFCILVTANHFWLDAFFGLVALGGGWLLATLAERVTGGSRSGTGRGEAKESAMTEPEAQRSPA